MSRSSDECVVALCDQWLVSFIDGKQKFSPVTLLILDFFFFNQFVHSQVLGLWRRELEKTDIPMLEEPGDVSWEKVLGKGSVSGSVVSSSVSLWTVAP